MRSDRLMHRLTSHGKNRAKAFALKKMKRAESAFRQMLRPNLQLEEVLRLWRLVLVLVLFLGFVFFLRLVLLFRPLLRLARRRLLAFRLRRSLLLLHLLRLLTRRWLLPPLLFICRPIVGRRVTWLRVGRRRVGAVACGCAVGLHVRRLCIRAIVVGAR